MPAQRSRWGAGGARRCPRGSTGQGNARPGRPVRSCGTTTERKSFHAESKTTTQPLSRTTAQRPIAADPPARQTGQPGGLATTYLQKTWNPTSAPSSNVLDTCPPATTGHPNRKLGAAGRCHAAAGRSRAQPGRCRRWARAFSVFSFASDDNCSTCARATADQDVAGPAAIAPCAQCLPLRACE